MTSKANRAACFLFALFTAVILFVTSYSPLVGLAYSTDTSTDLPSRWLGLLLLLPSVAGVVLLVGMLPAVKGRRLMWLGIGGLLLVPSLVACAWLGAAWSPGSVAGLAYLGMGWSLAHPRLALSGVQPAA